MINFIKHNIRALFLDMDGVLWCDSEPIGDLPNIFARISSLGLQVVLVTNNATRLVPHYIDKLAGFGVNISEAQIATSGEAVVYHLCAKYPLNTKVFVVGMNNLIEQIKAAGFIFSDTEVKAVIVGVDRNITYDKIRKASQLIRAGAEFIGTNPDRTFPTPQGLVPGAGAIIAAVAAASETEPFYVGKPGSILMDLSFSRLSGITKEQILVVGDRPETDIAAGINFSCQTALVLSGVTTAEMAQNCLPRPDYIFQDLAELLGA